MINLIFVFQVSTLPHRTRCSMPVSFLQEKMEELHLYKDKSREPDWALISPHGQSTDTNTFFGQSRVWLVLNWYYLLATYFRGQQRTHLCFKHGCVMFFIWSLSLLFYWLSGSETWIFLLRNTSFCFELVPWFSGAKPPFLPNLCQPIGRLFLIIQYIHMQGRKLTLTSTKLWLIVTLAAIWQLVNLERMENYFNLFIWLSIGYLIYKQLMYQFIACQKVILLSFTLASVSPVGSRVLHIKF